MYDKNLQEKSEKSRYWVQWVRKFYTPYERKGSVGSYETLLEAKENMLDDHYESLACGEECTYYIYEIKNNQSPLDCKYWVFNERE